MKSYECTISGKNGNIHLDELLRIDCPGHAAEIRRGDLLSMRMIGKERISITFQNCAKFVITVRITSEPAERLYSEIDKWMSQS